MPTTTPSSRRAAALACLALLPLWAGCATERTEPTGLLSLSPESAANRAMQTREFETTDELELLSASAAVLQDLGFQISEVEREAGFLRATKERSAREYGQEIQRTLIFLLTMALSSQSRSNAVTIVPTDLHQQINASLVARPIRTDGTAHEVRVLFYRLVWKSDGQSGNLHIRPGLQRMEMIRDAGIYQQFFARLQKSVFLEEQKI